MPQAQHTAKGARTSAGGSGGSGGSGDSVRSGEADVSVWTADDLRDNPHDHNDKAEKVRRMFGAIARHYDLNNRLHS